jgi:hypothetical protein
MSIITTPGNGTAFTTAELIINFERLAYLSTQHDDEPVPDPIVPSAEYKVIDVWNDVYRNVPNYVEHHGKRMIWSLNRMRASIISISSVSDADWDLLVSYINETPTNTTALETWLRANITSIPSLKISLAALFDVININIKLVNQWFNLSISEVNYTELFLALDAQNEAWYNNQVAIINATLQAHTDAYNGNLVQIVNPRAMDDAVVVDRLVNYSNVKFLPNTVVTIDWIPS